MQHSEREVGTIHALLEAFVKQKLPRALEIKKRVDEGDVLNEVDIEFLERIFHEARENRGHVEQFPEYGDIVNLAVQVYHDITEKALENEKLRSGKN